MHSSRHGPAFRFDAGSRPRTGNRESLDHRYRIAAGLHFGRSVELELLMTRPLRLVTLALSVALLAACQTGHGIRQTPAAATDSRAAVGAPSANDTFNAVSWMQTSAEYAALTTQTYRAVCDMLPAAVADPQWTALAGGEQSGGFETLPPAIIADVDETLLDNSAYAARRIRVGGPFDPVMWKTWINEAAATPMPGVDELIDCLAANGVTLIYISNRNHDGERQATIDNLRSTGFPLPEGAEDRVLLRDDPRGAGSERSDKGGRRHWAATRYRVVALLGDNLGDFLDGVKATPAQRAALVEPYNDWWGRRWFMFANPSYGSWENALLDGCAAAKTDPESCRWSHLREQ